MQAKTPDRRDEQLDEALEETFPASDPIALSASNRHAHDEQAHVAGPAKRPTLHLKPKDKRSKPRS
ncbi:MAG: hypothetical protein ACM3ZT_09825 [Bacillota bacterium]